MADYSIVAELLLCAFSLCALLPASIQASSSLAAMAARYNDVTSTAIWLLLLLSLSSSSRTAYEMKNELKE